jgi:predicted N-acyltransferase
MLSVSRVSSISEIDQSTWDSLLTAREFLNSYRFVRAVEMAKVENASFQYLLFYDGRTLVGHAVLSCFSISLDLFVPDNRVVHWVRKLSPTFFNVRILFSGLPASLGQLNLKVRPGWEDHVTNAMHSEMESLASVEKVNLLCVKEFKGDNVGICKALLHHEFFQAFSLPYMVLDIDWKTFHEYLYSLRHPYRRAVKRSLKKFGAEEPVILISPDAPKGSLPGLVLGDSTICPPARMHALYIAVMGRTPTKLETLNLAFFENLYACFSDELEILTVQQNERIIGAALLVSKEDEMTFMLIGREDAKDDIDSYFNLVYGIIQLAIERGIKKVNMGQTAYWVKQRVGARPEPVYIYFKSRKPIINFLLTRMNRLLFPELKFAAIKVFNQSLSLTHKFPLPLSNIEI